MKSINSFMSVKGSFIFKHINDQISISYIDP